MAKYNDAVSVTFKDNDGGVGWSANPDVIKDVIRHWKIFGVWRTRWILFKRFWIGLMWLEDYCDNTKLIRKQSSKWIVKAEIPE